MKIVRPRVTMLSLSALATKDGTFDGETNAEEWLEPQPGSSRAEYLTEFAGRSCYQSFNRPNPATAETKDYIKRTLFDQGHWSIAEHASVTFYLEGVSRAFTHELIRHRHLSYSQLSQRFVDGSDIEVVLPPALELYYSNHEGTTTAFDNAVEAAQKAYKELASVLLEDGYTRKQAREAARSVLPNATETKIVVTGNLRAWSEFCNRRMQPDADAEMQVVAGMIYEKLRACAPNIFPQREEETTHSRESELDDLAEGSAVTVAERLFVKHNGGWEHSLSKQVLASWELADLGEYELLYKGR